MTTSETEQEHYLEIPRLVDECANDRMTFKALCERVRRMNCSTETLYQAVVDRKAAIRAAKG